MTILKGAKIFLNIPSKLIIVHAHYWIPRLMVLDITNYIVLKLIIYR